MNNKTIYYWIQLSYHMKNYGDLGGCYPPWPTASTDNTLLDLHNFIRYSASFFNCQITGSRWEGKGVSFKSQVNVRWDANSKCKFHLQLLLLCKYTCMYSVMQVKVSCGMITLYIKGLFTMTLDFVFLCSFISLNLSNLSTALKCEICYFLFIKLFIYSI